MCCGSRTDYVDCLNLSVLIYPQEEAIFHTSTAKWSTPDSCSCSLQSVMDSSALKKATGQLQPFEGRYLYTCVSVPVIKIRFIFCVYASVWLWKGYSGGSEVGCIRHLGNSWSVHRRKNNIKYNHTWRLLGGKIKHYIFYSA